MAQAIQRQTAATGRPFWTTERREAMNGWLFALPWIIGFIVFTAGPMLFSVYTSFTRYNITTPPRWIGWDNYERLFRDPNFYISLRNTFWMVIFKTPLVVVISIAIALLLIMNLPGGKTFRTIFYLPNVLAGVAAVLLCR